MPEPAKPLRIFLSYAHADVLSVRKLHRYLREKGLDVWFDKDNLLPGQDWRLEIGRGLSHSDVVIVCLSQAAVSKEGFFQKEFKFALDRALAMPEGRIFLIPVRLQVCEVPISLSRYHWVDLFDDEGYQRLMRGLKLRAEQLERIRIEMPDTDVSSQDSNLDVPVSVRKDKQENVIVGNDNTNQAVSILPDYAETKKQAAQKVEQEQAARKKVEAEKAAQQKAEQERLAILKTENERIARLKIEQDRITRQKAEAVNMARQKAENENKAREKAAREQRARLARTKTKNQFMTISVLLGCSLLVVMGCFVLWWLVLALAPLINAPTPTSTPEVFSRTTIISNVTMSADPTTGITTTIFKPDQTFYCVVVLANASDTTKVKSIWYSVDVTGAAIQFGQNEVVGNGNPITFNATNTTGPWSIGKYRVEIYLNDKLDRLFEFFVE